MCLEHLQSPVNKLQVYLSTAIYSIKNVCKLRHFAICNKTAYILTFSSFQNPFGLGTLFLLSSARFQIVCLMVGPYAVSSELSYNTVFQWARSNRKRLAGRASYPWRCQYPVKQRGRPAPLERSRSFSYSREDNVCGNSAA